MGGSADQRVGRVGQSVENVLTDQPAVFGLHQRLQQVVDHLRVDGAWWGKKLRDPTD